VNALEKIKIPLKASFVKNDKDIKILLQSMVF
jgi:hypothetical protein